MKTTIQRAKHLMTLALIISLGGIQTAYCNTSDSTPSLTEVHHAEAKQPGVHVLYHLNTKGFAMKQINITKQTFPKTLTLTTSFIETFKTDLLPSDIEFSESVVYGTMTSRELELQSNWKGPGRYKKYNGKFLA